MPGRTLTILSQLNDADTQRVVQDIGLSELYTCRFLGSARKPDAGPADVLVCAAHDKAAEAWIRRHEPQWVIFAGTNGRIAPAGKGKASGDRSGAAPVPPPAYTTVLEGLDEGASQRIRVWRRQAPTLLALRAALAPGRAFVRFQQLSIVDFYAPIDGSGWFQPEFSNNVGFRWMSHSEPAEIALPNTFFRSLAVNIHVAHVVDPLLLRELEISANGVRLAHAVAQHGSSNIIAVGVGPVTLARNRERTRLGIAVTAAWAERMRGRPGSDSRQLALAVSHIELLEASEVQPELAGAVPARTEPAPVGAPEEVAALTPPPVASDAQATMLSRDNRLSRYRVSLSVAPATVPEGVIDFFVERRAGLLYVRFRRDQGTQLQLLAEPWLPKDDQGVFVEIPLAALPAAAERRVGHDREILATLANKAEAIASAVAVASPGQV